MKARGETREGRGWPVRFYRGESLDRSQCRKPDVPLRINPGNFRADPHPPCKQSPTFSPFRRKSRGESTWKTQVPIFPAASLVLSIAIFDTTRRLGWGGGGGGEGLCQKFLSWGSKGFRFEKRPKKQDLNENRGKRDLLPGNVEDYQWKKPGALPPFFFSGGYARGIGGKVVSAEEEEINCATEISIS